MSEWASSDRERRCHLRRRHGRGHDGGSAAGPAERSRSTSTWTPASRAVRSRRCGRGSGTTSRTTPTCQTVRSSSPSLPPPVQCPSTSVRTICSRAVTGRQPSSGDRPTSYTEDATGRPVYDWTILDRILDTYMARQVKPLVELGFMPEALSSHPQPYRHFWKPGDNYDDIYTGWSYPPRDYTKWGELDLPARPSCRREVRPARGRHLVVGGMERAGHRLLARHAGRVHEALRLRRRWAQARAADGPDRRPGSHGPERRPHPNASCGTSSSTVLHGTNYATGRVGSPLGLVTFHAKGAPQVMPDGHVRMNVGNQLRAIANGFGVVVVSELAQAPDRHRASPIPRAAPRARSARIRRTPIATGRCSRATRPSSSRERSS